MTKIGTAIRAERTARGLTLTEISRGAGFSIPYVGDIEHGNRLPPHKTMLRIAAQLPDVSCAAWSWLLAEDLFGAAAVEAMREHAALKLGEQWLRANESER